jgi:hypothetical protein
MGSGASWKREDIAGDETIWRKPEDGNWYEERRALQILKGGEDIGASE